MESESAFLKPEDLSLVGWSNQNRGLWLSVIPGLCDPEEMHKMDENEATCGIALISFKEPF